VEVSRKDVTRLQANEDVKVFFRFRDFQGDWAMHCTTSFTKITP
jgi:ribosomal protein S3AE